MAHGNCHECGVDIEVGIWDDPALSGAVVLFCTECLEQTPESCLWDVSALEAAHDEWPGEDEHHPNLLPEHPLEDGESWALRDRYGSRETYLTHLRASWTGTPPDEFDDDIAPPDEEARWDLFVRDADDAAAIEEGREALEAKVQS